MKIKTGYNTLVNEALKKLGEYSNGEVEVYEENEKVAQNLQHSLKEEILVKITAKKEIYGFKTAIRCFGYTVAKASGRDSGAFIPPTISLIDGKTTSGGSAKNWKTIIEQDSTFEFKVPKILFEKYKETEEENWIVELAKEKKVTDLI